RQQTVVVVEVGRTDGGDVRKSIEKHGALAFFVGALANLRRAPSVQKIFEIPAQRRSQRFERLSVTERRLDTRLGLGIQQAIEGREDYRPQSLEFCVARGHDYLIADRACTGLRRQIF